MTWSTVTSGTMDVSTVSRKLGSLREVRSVADVPSITGGAWFPPREECTDQVSLTIAPRTPWILVIGVAGGREDSALKPIDAAPSQGFAEPLVIASYPFEPSSQATLDVTSGKLGLAVNELAQLKSSACEDGLEDPTEYANRCAAQVLGRAYTIFWLQDFLEYNKLVKPDVTTDDLGGVRISWRISSRVLRANFGADVKHRSYLYFEDGQFRGVDELRGETLAERLRWLVLK